MKAILIGRHAGTQIPGVEIIEQRAIVWPATAIACIPVFHDLLLEAYEKDAKILFQNVPGQLAACLGKWCETREERGRIGIIISKPNKRETGLVKIFSFAEQGDATEAAEAMRLVNPNAKLEWVNPTHLSVTVDPPMKFEFNHIEWI